MKMLIYSLGHIHYGSPLHKFVKLQLTVIIYLKLTKTQLTLILHHMGRAAKSPSECSIFKPHNSLSHVRRPPSLSSDTVTFLIQSCQTGHVSPPLYPPDMILPYLQRDRMEIYQCERIQRTFFSTRSAHFWPLIIDIPTATQ